MPLLDDINKSFDDASIETPDLETAREAGKNFTQNVIEGISNFIIDIREQLKESGNKIFSRLN